MGRQRGVSGSVNTRRVVVVGLGVPVRGAWIRNRDEGVGGGGVRGRERERERIGVWALCAGLCVEDGGVRWARVGL